jgi:hypothetical protein
MGERKNPFDGLKHVGYTQNMRFVPVLLLLVFISQAAFADVYHWTDKQGVLHITNDIGNVPEEYRSEAEVIVTEPVEEEPLVETPPSKMPERGGQEELYGDQPLSWWIEKLGRMKKEIEELESELNRKKMFTDVYERGWMMRELYFRVKRGEDPDALRALERGAIYTPAQIETYERYKDEVLGKDKDIKRLEEELDELRRKARIQGVPRKIRE